MSREYKLAGNRCLKTQENGTTTFRTNIPHDRNTGFSQVTAEMVSPVGEGLISVRSPIKVIIQRFTREGSPDSTDPIEIFPLTRSVDYAINIGHRSIPDLSVRNRRGSVSGE